MLASKTCSVTCIPNDLIGSSPVVRCVCKEIEVSDIYLPKNKSATRLSGERPHRDIYRRDNTLFRCAFHSRYWPLRERAPHTVSGGARYVQAARSHPLITYETHLISTKCYQKHDQITNTFHPYALPRARRPAGQCIRTHTLPRRRPHPPRPIRSLHHETTPLSGALAPGPCSAT